MGGHDVRGVVNGILIGYIIACVLGICSNVSLALVGKDWASPLFHKVCYILSFLSLIVMAIAGIAVAADEDAKICYDGDLILGRYVLMIVGAVIFAISGILMVLIMVYYIVKGRRSL